MTVAPAATTPQAPRCACGHPREHPAVEAEPVYGTLGFLLAVMLGMGGFRPKKVVFRCSRCGQVIEESTDPQVLARAR